MNYKVLGKYIKNLEFNVPNTKTFFLLSKDIANYKINIDIRSLQVEKNVIEILTSLNLSPVNIGGDKINTRITHATVIEILNNKISKEEIKKIILIDVPSKIYIELRTMFVSLFENCGFKDVKINEQVDFEKLYNNRNN